MKYMIMMNTPAGAGPSDYQINNWSPESFRAHMDFMHAINKELRDAGEWVQGEGLAAPSEAKLVRARKDGAPITDGPFAESKEFLAGFWIVDVENAERAYELAGQISAAPGPNGQPLNMPVEVRQVMSVPPSEI
jgi:hypothetical protein